MNPLYDFGHYMALQDNVIKEYKQKIADILEYLNELETDQKVFVYLKEFINEIDFENKFTQTIYWINQVEEYLSIDEVYHEWLEESEDPDLEVELFDSVNRSDFAEDFKSELDKKTSKIEAYKKIISKMANQLVQFHRKYFREDQAGYDAKYYKQVYELAEMNDPEFIKIEFSDISLRFISADKENFKIHKDRLQSALRRLIEYSPQSVIPLKFFTNTIIPICDKGVVSYSSQNIPRFSMINIDERDDIDLLDDLLHENGHHHLNFYLNHVELLNEDDDQIYYSPWRRSLRPVRGIYHAVFTFYWALKLFCDLSEKAMKLPLTQDQKNKVHVRFVEEYIMLTYCKPFVDHAWKNGKITKPGKELIDLIYAELDKSKGYYLQMEKLTEIDPQIKELKDHLNKMREEYPLS